MFGAAFGFRVPTTLVPVEGDTTSLRTGVTARVYKAVLGENLPSILSYGAIFMHDNALIHKAHIVRDRHQDNRINVMDWPPYSPDLNPIENPWALLKVAIYRSYPDVVGIANTQASLDLLIQCAIAIWEELSEQLLLRLLAPWFIELMRCLRQTGGIRSIGL